MVGGQTGADMEIVDALMGKSTNQSSDRSIAHCELVHVECEPGDVLFFHSNLLHCSAANTSANPRLSLICCYNAKSNNPIRESHHPTYTPINRSKDDAILEHGQRVKDGLVDWLMVEQARRDAYLDPEKDATTPGSRKAGVAP